MLISTGSETGYEIEIVYQYSSSDGKHHDHLNIPKAEVGIGLMMPAHHSSRCDFHFWILLLLLIASPQGTVSKIQVKSCWKSLADRLLQESVKFSLVDIFYTDLILNHFYHRL